MNNNDCYINILAILWLINFYNLRNYCVLLYSENGIRPIITTLNNINKVTNYWKKFYHFPSLFWIISPNNNNIINSIYIGFVSSIFIIFTKHKSLFLFINYIIYLSFVSIGSEFLYYQWDFLLLELTLLSSIYHYTNYELFSKFLIYILFLKINWMNLYKKLISNNNNWINGSAFKYHLWTQPSPNKFALKLYNYPNIVLKLINYYVLLTEWLSPITLLIYPISTIINYLLYITIYLLIGNTPLYYLLCLNILTLYLPINIVYYIPSIQFNILNYIFYSIILYTYYDNNSILKVYYFNHNYSIYIDIPLVRKELQFYKSDDNKKWDKLELNDDENLINHNYITWQLWTSSFLPQSVNNWLLRLMHIIIENKMNTIFKNKLDNQPKYLKIILYELTPNNKESIEIGNLWTKTKIDNYIIITNNDTILDNNIVDNDTIFDNKIVDNKKLL